MAVPAGKTPISYLQELSTKRGITPQYDLIANEGAVHEPTFLMRVTVGDVSATGKGSSKKKAKHAAAQTALNQILGVSNGEVKQETTEPTESGENGLPGNPIGELQEFTQKKLMKPPIYEFTNEQGPPHAKEFICNVKLGKFHERGTGRSKKTAKRNAASNMMQHIKSLTNNAEKEAKLEESDEEDEIPLSFEPKASYTALKQGKQKLMVTSPQQAVEIKAFYDKIVKASGKVQGQSQAPATNFCQMLQEIAEIQRFEVHYYDIKELSGSGQHQCLVQLSTMPIAVCHGQGSTLDDAHGNAAHNALQYLKIMTKS
ncbi:RISC-loading complex subunit tarbp2-like [Gigantopelta aegis]|uniref:RISC-loading complex subunit tarbp2-like n=1 Tax=Gigantopelta aegis TaxID=1735272 RepID=UPI001B88C9D6|nr:RISC-loading complex subunit tarbp2-like [Gigantopelta aegis]